MAAAKAQARSAVMIRVGSGHFRYFPIASTCRSSRIIPWRATAAVAAVAARQGRRPRPGLKFAHCQRNLSIIGAGFPPPEHEMTDLTLEHLQTALRPLHTGLAELGSRIGGLASEMAAMKSELSNLGVRVDGLASEMTNVRIRVDGLASEMANVRIRVDGLASEIDGLASEMANVRIRVDGLASEIANVRIRVDGLPLLGVAVETLRRDVRMTRAAINDMARINITAGEVESLHTDIDRTIARLDAIEARLATLEQLTGQQQIKQ
jgi:chromosome segregation ATPase